MVDNFRFEIISDRNLEDALRIAFSNHQKATHYRIEPRRGLPSQLVLGWHASMRNGVALPAPVRADDGTAFSLIISWLNEQDLGPKPDLDGHVGKGWKMNNGSWGHIDDDFYAFVAVEPVWAEYHK